MNLKEARDRLQNHAQYCLGEKDCRALDIALQALEKEIERQEHARLELADLETMAGRPVYTSEGLGFLVMKKSGSSVDVMTLGGVTYDASIFLERGLYRCDPSELLEDEEDDSWVDRYHLMPGTAGEDDSR